MSEAKPIERDEMIRHKKPTVAERRVTRQKVREEKEIVKEVLKEKYDEITTHCFINQT